MMFVGIARTSTVPRTPNASSRKPARTAAAEAADEHDVHHAHRGAEAAEPVRTHGLQHRRRPSRTRTRQHRLRDAEDDEPRDAVRGDLQRREERRRHDERADEHERLGRVLAVRAVEVAADGVAGRERAATREAEDDAALGRSTSCSVSFR